MKSRLSKEDNARFADKLDELIVPVDTDPKNYAEFKLESRLSEADHEKLDALKKQ